MLELESWLANCIDKKLELIVGSFYCANDTQPGYDEFDEISFKFQLSKHGKFSCGADGVSLEWSEKEIQGTELGEYGVIVPVDVSNTLPFEGYIGRSLLNAGLLRSGPERLVVGVTLEFSSGRALSVLNLGDELFIYERIPQLVQLQQKLEYFPV